jgi:hypothetical protein
MLTNIYGASLTAPVVNPFTGTNVKFKTAFDLGTGTTVSAGGNQKLVSVIAFEILQYGATIQLDGMLWSGAAERLDVVVCSAGNPQ